ncbi:cold-regulated protein 27-like isoform X1 [Syzygium oleosum]|uniref:cold-regulated protein 27-like isoform X1 n=1 Tax=Syzygium oleosum TaxID=219896 RepID=UPI0011D2AD1A|nr:cold-regulated protein 27-like isoform X1 [Syzygium oleosum]
MEAPRRTDYSGTSSGTSSEFPHREPMIPDLPGTDSSNTEWTDEKHSLYLKSMEATFVDQLYDSMELLGWHLEKANFVDPLTRQSNKQHPYAPSGQFKVLRDGSWKKINFERPDLQVEKADGSRDLLKSPWIQHFRPASRVLRSGSPNYQTSSGKGKKALAYASAGNSEQFHACHSYFGNQIDNGNAEVTDQNFVDEDIGGRKGSNMCSAKKAKTSGTDSSDNDQVVPFSRPATAGDAGEKWASSSR